MILTQPPADQRILIGATATLSWQPADSDGEPAAPAGTITIGVVDETGATVVAAGTATSGSSSNPRTYTLAAQTQLRRLVATWTDGTSGATATTSVEVVGGYYFTLAQARQWSRELEDEARYPTAKVVEARRQVEEEFEQLTRVAFVPRYRRFRVSGNGRCRLVLPLQRVRTVRSVRAYTTGSAYTALDATALASITVDEAGIAERQDGGVFTWGTDNLVLEVEHGYDRPPADVVEAALKRLLWRLNRSRSGVPSNAERFTTPDGTFVFAQVPTKDRLGDVEIDPVLARYRRDDLLVG